MKEPLVSVIITTKNSQNLIKNCLISIEKQTYKNIQIIVVDNYSTDSTKKICRSYLSVIFLEKSKERSAQRNFGAQKSRGEYLLFLDSDMSLNKNLIKECVNIIKNNNSLIGLYIPEQISGNGFWLKIRNFERSFYNNTVIDALRFIRKKAFFQTGGYDESLWGGEDWDLDKRIKKLGKTGIIHSPLYHNENYFSLENYLLKKKYYLKSLILYKRKWGKNDIDIKKQLGFFYRFIGVFIEDGKWKKLMAAPHLTLGMFFLRVLVGLSYAKAQKEKNLANRSQLQR